MKQFFKHPEITSALTHFIGMGLAIAGLVLMIIAAAETGGAARVVGVSIFGSTLVLLYAASSLYHFFPSAHHHKKFLQRLDHSMIYILIAGTYTPLCLVLPNRGWGWTLFGIIWGLAALGVISKNIRYHTPSWISVVHYLVMGWLIILATAPVTQFLSPTAIAWLFGGGMAYTAGVIFFALERFFPRRSWFGMHDVFHVFVMVGSFAHFWFVFWHIV